MAPVAVPGQAVAKQVQSIDLICLISVEYNFTPALNNNTVTASGLGLLSDCTSPNGHFPALKSGTVFNTNDVIAHGCWPAPLTMTGGQSKILWNDGTDSTFTVTLSTDPTLGVLRLNAFVTDGRLKGAHAAAIPVAVGQRGLCLPGPLAPLAGALGGALGGGGVRSAQATFGAMPIYHWIQDPATKAKRTAAKKGTSAKRSTHASRR